MLAELLVFSNHFFLSNRVQESVCGRIHAIHRLTSTPKLVYLLVDATNSSASQAMTTDVV